MKTTSAKIRFPFRKKIHVRENHKGFLFKNGVLVNILEPGNYLFWDFKNVIQTVEVPTEGRFPYIELNFITKDFIEIQLFVWIEYKIKQMALAQETFLFVDAYGNKYSVSDHMLKNYFFKHIHQTTIGKDFFSAYNQIQQYLTELSGLGSAESNSEYVKEFNGLLHSMGIEIKDFHWHLKLPKKVENLFHQMLEKKVRAEAELENARAVVAAARALKNASEIIKGDENILFLRYLETLVKIAEKGKHSFVLPSSLPEVNIKKNP